MKTTTEILDETLVNIEAARYRITIECFYSDTLRIHTKILEAAAFLTNAIKDTKSVGKTEGFAQVFPEHKYAIVKSLQKLGQIVGMYGDGVNDAPALKHPDVGIAVSGASDATRANSHRPRLSLIINGIEEARSIFARMTSYTLYRDAMTTDKRFLAAI